MFGNAAKAYQTIALQTDTPWRLIDRLYEGAIQRIDQKRIEDAKRIVEEGLLESLDPNVEFSKGMAQVYEGIIVHLSPGGDPACARNMLVLMHEAWLGIRPPGG